MIQRRRILVTGVSGVLGSTLARTLGDRFDLRGTFYRHPVALPQTEAIQLDVTDSRDVLARIQAIRPEVVIHCAAETRVDWCEENGEQAQAVNVAGTRNLVEAAERNGAQFVYISTDAVFNGAGGPYAEDAVASPQNVYGRTKLDGEAVVQEHASRYLILRTNFFGWGLGSRPTLAEWFLDQLRAGREVPGFVDVVFSPLLANDLAGMIGDLIVQDRRGLFHLGSRDWCSKYEFGRLVARAFDLDPDLVKPASVVRAGLQAPRAKDTSLNSQKCSQALGSEMPTVADGVARLRALERAGYREIMQAREP